MATYFFDGEAHIVYDPSAGKNIFEESRDVINTLLQHELIHALVNWELANNPEGEFAKTMSALQDILDKEIKRRKVDPRKVYQPTPSDLNLYEFVASFSNPDFITFARSVEIVKDSKSLWKAILDAILDFLGVTQSNVYDAGFAALERLYSIPKEGSGQVIGIEQPLNLDAVYEELSAKVSQSGDASTQTTLDTIYYEGEESDQQKIELMRKAVDGASKGTFAMATSIASVIGADITKFANLDAFAQWIKPGVEAKELKKNKTAYTTLYELFSNALAYPSLRIFKNLDSTVRTYLIAKENNIPLSTRSELGKIVSTIYKYGLSRKEKDDLNTAFARKSAEFVEASLAAKEDYLVTLLLSSEAERAKERQVELVLFTNRVNKVTNLINELGPEIEKNYKQAFKIEQLTSKLAAGKNVGTVKFIDNNFSSVDHYRVAREWMYNAMHTMIATNGVAGVQKTRREIVHNLYVALVARVAALKSQVDLGVVATGSITPALEHGALSSMLAQYDGAPLLYYMLTEIYPNWTVDSIEDVEEDILAEEIDDLTVGIKKETEEADRVDVETRLSDSVKEFLSFIKNPTEGATKQYLGSKHTFFLAAKLVTSYLDTSRLNLWDQQVKAVFRDFLSDNEKAVITKLDLLVREAKSEPNRKDIAVWVFEDSINESKIGVGYVPNTNISNMSALEVKNLAEQNRFLIRSWTFADALEQVNKWGADINEVDFNQIVRQAKAVNTLRELHNSLSSLTEKNYMVGSVENDMGTISTSYMTASGFGLDKSLNSQVRAALHAFDQKYGIEQLIIQAKDIYDLAGQNDAEAIHKLINFLGLSGLSNYLDIKARKSSEVFAAIRGFFERARDKSPDDTIDDFLADQRSFFRSLTNVIKYNVDALRQTSIIDSAGHRIHKLVPKSYFYEVVEYFTKAYRAKEPKIGGVTGSLSWMLKATPQHLENDFYSHSSFVNGLQRIYGVAEHDASKNENSLKVTGFSRENDRQFFIRQFVHGFLDMIDSYSSDVTYGQFLYQPGVKPRIPLVRVRVLNKDEVITSLADMARQLSAYPDSSSMKTKVSSKVGPGINASFVVEALKLDSNPEKAAKIAYKMMQDASKNYLRSMLSNTIPVPATLDKVAKKLQSDSAHGRFDYLAEALKKIPSRVANRKLSEEGGTEYDADTLYDLLEPLAELFYTNNYVNSFFLNQLFTGPYDFYKSTDDIVKRISGVLAPGIKPFVDPQLGSQEEFSVVVFADVEREKSAIEQFLDAILDPPSANYTSEQRANDIEEVTRFFSTFASTDSQGFMSEKRWNDLAKGYGAA